MLGVELLPKHRERICLEMLADAIVARDPMASRAVPLDERSAVVRDADKLGSIDDCLPFELLQASRLVSQIVARLLADSNSEASKERARLAAEAAAEEVEEEEANADDGEDDDEHGAPSSQNDDDFVSPGSQGSGVVAQHAGVEVPPLTITPPE